MVLHIRRIRARFCDIVWDLVWLLGVWLLRKKHAESLCFLAFLPFCNKFWFNTIHVVDKSDKFDARAQRRKERREKTSLRPLRQKKIQ